MDWLKDLFGKRRGAEDDAPAAYAEPVAQAAAIPPGAPGLRYAFSDKTVQIAAIGDLHGRIDLLRRIAGYLGIMPRREGRRLIEVYLGDFVDRAGDAKAVIDFLIERSARSDREVVCLAGNHEQMMLAALDSDKDFSSWLGFGGQPTLLSYGVPPVNTKVQASRLRAAFREAIPPAHVEFLRGLRRSYHHGEFFFAHAGVRPGKPLDQQETADLLWIRDSFIRSFANFGAVVVHGHTPVDAPQFRPNRIGIDTGAYYSGRLTCLLVSSDEVRAVDTVQLAAFSAPGS